MLTIQSLTYLQNGNSLLEKCDLQVFPNQRIGLVGKNGCGKSTLFQLIRGVKQPDNGEVMLQPGKTIAFVEQEIINSNLSVIEFVLDGDMELRQLEKILSQPHHDDAWFEAQQRFEIIGGYTAQARAAQLLNGLGFSNDALQKFVNQFSGGWRMRLNLARALMHRADLLLLDEPTNHLDLEAIVWLENYLLNYPGSIIVVSHDREFLNACINRIAYINNHKIDTYQGNYDDFEQARAERLMQHTQAYEQQQKHIAHMEDFVRRFRAKATKARQAQSRIKALERLTRLAPLHVEEGHFELRIDAPEQGPEVLMRINDLSFDYGNHTLFEHVQLILQSGTRIALLGPNGSGKSTFIKLLVGEIQPTRGVIERSANLDIGYFAQHQLEYLDSQATPLQHLQKLAPTQTERNLRTFLGRFGLGSEHENRPVGTFSGGEKSRLALALLAWQKPHLLLLDEPTNHLDLDMRDALTLALEQYTGAVLLVSHDRSLIRAIADELWLIADKAVQPFNGGLEDYKAWVDAYQSKRTEKPSQQKTQSAQRPANKPNKKGLLQKQAKLEVALDKAQKELADVNRRLSDPNVYANPSRTEIEKLSEMHATLEKKVIELEESWLALEVEMEE